MVIFHCYVSSPEGNGIGRINILRIFNQPFLPLTNKNFSSGTWVTENISLDHLQFHMGEPLAQYSTGMLCVWYISPTFAGVVVHIGNIPHMMHLEDIYICISLYMYRHLTQTHTNMADPISFLYETKLSHPFEPLNIHKHIYIIYHPIIAIDI